MMEPEHFGNTSATTIQPIIKMEEMLEEHLPNHSESEPSCLICSSLISRKLDDDVDVDYWWKQLSFQRPGEPSTLSGNVCWIFVLRKLLHYPEEQVAALLSSTGVGPGAWCTLCGTCSELVSEALHIHVQVVKLEAKMNRIGSRLRAELRESLLEHFPNYGDEEGVLSVQKIIRQFYAGQEEGPDAMIQTPASQGHHQEDHENGDPLYTPSDDDDDDDEIDHNTNTTYLSRMTEGSNKMWTRKSQTKYSGGESANKEENKGKKIRKGPHSCNICDFETRFLSEFKSHMGKHAKQLKKLRCPICQHPASNQKGLVRHVERAHPKTPMTCDQCGFTTEAASTYYRHENEHKIRDCLEPAEPNDELLLRCKFCETTGPWLKMQLHVKSKHLPQIGIDSFSCTQCDYVAFKASHLRLHCARIHGTSSTSGEALVKQWKCELCPSEYYEKEQLTGHMKTAHSGGRANNAAPLECSVLECGVQFASRELMNSHMRQEHPELFKFKCDACGNTFRTNNALWKHNQTQHSEAVDCGYCGKGFKSGLFLERHLKKRCKGKPTSSSAINNNSSQLGLKWAAAGEGGDQVSVYSCAKCNNYSASSKVSLGRHLQNHFIADYFAAHPNPSSQCQDKGLCRLCHKGVLLKERYNHLNTKHHSVIDIHLYQCELCGMGFNSNVSFANHSRGAHKPNKRAAGVPIITKMKKKKKKKKQSYNN